MTTDTQQFNTYYHALVARDPEFVGVFFVGVKTTNIFCIATCRARKPKKENVEFFSSFKEALSAGYRPCKVCRPTENASEAPEQVKQAIQLVQQNPKEKITDYRLTQHDIRPEIVRRWFKKHYSMTFHTFQRMYRINYALEEIKQGKTSTQTAFDVGYESLSGFGYTFKKVLGKSPMNSKTENTILIDRFTTPLGPMFVCATQEGICLLEFVDRRMLETEFKDLQRLLRAPIIAGENAHTQQAKKEMAEYFQGQRFTFDTPLVTPGTAFQQQVWQALLKIEYGRTTSYQQQAAILGKPNAVRAMAAANGCNRIAIMIPCHRVIGKNGNLTGYGGGLERKRWLIEHEKKYCV